mmetsp:Transcript_3278/g.6388  ORF Transcript_3278/g.6388 Transcript_3278/m.6388 type:complete len:308 (-) Transcript_3278:102-1025(-)
MREGDAADAAAVSLSAEEAHALGVLHVPDADRGVVGARGDERGVRVEGGAAHVRVVAEHHADGLRLVGRPEAERAVVAAGGEKGADRREGDRPDGRRVRVVTNKARALRQAPQTRRAVLRAGDEEVVVAREAAAVDGTRVASEGDHLRPTRSVLGGRAIQVCRRRPHVRVACDAVGGRAIGGVIGGVWFRVVGSVRLGLLPCILLRLEEAEADGGVGAAAGGGGTVVGEGDGAECVLGVEDGEEQGRRLGARHRDTLDRVLCKLLLHLVVERRQRHARLSHELGLRKGQLLRLRLRLATPVGPRVSA